MAASDYTKVDLGADDLGKIATAFALHASKLMVAAMEQGKKEDADWDHIQATIERAKRFMDCSKILLP